MINSQFNLIKIFSVLFFLVSGPFQSQEVSFLFMGDIMGHGPQIRSAYQNPEKKYNYDKVFEPLEDIISSVDFAVANLEVTLAGPPYMGYPQFSSPDELAEACKNNGMDVLVTANNHSCDRKNSGVIRTVEVLDSFKILHTGTFKDEKKRDQENLLILSKKGIKVGLLNYTYGTNGIPFSTPAYVNMLDSSLIKQDVINARKKKLDKLIVFVHWGYEYRDFPNSYQKKFNTFFNEIGVDVVIGSHPHVLQPMIYNIENNKEFLTVFSLGNFVSNQRESRKDGGAMFRLSFEKKGGKVYISRKEYVLTWVHKFMDDGKYQYQILPCAKAKYNERYFSEKNDFQKMNLFLVNSRKHLNNNNKSVEEGVPYGLAKAKDIAHTRSPIPELKMTNYISTKKKKIRRIKKSRK
ncbi:MAG: CapA family protein [Crocinitomicaceae bacterium TMED135]|nr:MAG: CapA family protein [Crocinitomicaceae bacterium TMED135]